jgi:hypothetical protein
LNPIELIWAQVKGFVAENNTTFRLKDVKELVYGGFGRITKAICNHVGLDSAFLVAGLVVIKINYY